MEVPMDFSKANKFQRGYMMAKVGFAVWKIKRDFGKATKAMRKARRFEARAKQRREDARLIVSNLGLTASKADDL